MPTAANTIASASDANARMVVSIVGVWRNPATLWAMPELSSSHASLSPHVVLIGGFLTEAAQYQPMRSRLLAHGAAAVSIAPIHLPDWAVMGFAGMGPLLLRGARAIREARRASAAPVVVVGHSMGGIIARLAMAPSPLDGRWAGVADDVACLVTLGTPHYFTPSVPWRHAGQRAAEHLERVSPGAFFAPTTGYLTVGSTRVRPAPRLPAGSPVALLNRVLGAFVGETPGVRSDGLVCSDRCRLDGARHIEFDDVLHGLVYGPWYGDGAVIARWWPAAVEEWRAALAVRAARTGEQSPDGASPAGRAPAFRGARQATDTLLSAAREASSGASGARFGGHW
jgi:hypothetical protein